MEQNITLIGMPGSGKSTVGIILAKLTMSGFLDTDVLIQINRQKALQQLLDEAGYLALRSIEEAEILKLNISNHVIATGGSAVYGAAAMDLLCKGSTVVYLYAPIDELTRRIHNFDSRGIAKTPGQSFQNLFEERDLLYRKYAHHIVDTMAGIEETAEAIAGLVQ